MIRAAWSLRPLAWFYGAFSGVVGLPSGPSTRPGSPSPRSTWAAAVWLFAAIGAYASVFSTDRATSTNLTVLVAMALLASPVLTFLHWSLASVWWGVGSPTYAASLTLFSQGEVRDHLRGQAPAYVDRFSLPVGEGLPHAVAVAAISPVVCGPGGVRPQPGRLRPVRSGGSTDPDVSGRLRIEDFRFQRRAKRVVLKNQHDLI